MKTGKKAKIFKKISKETGKGHLCCITQHNKKCKDNHCLFAHSRDELVPIKCQNAGLCKKKQQCKYIHPGESKEKFLYRRYGTKVS